MIVKGLRILLNSLSPEDFDDVEIELIDETTSKRYTLTGYTWVRGVRTTWLESASISDTVMKGISFAFNFKSD